MAHETVYICDSCESYVDAKTDLFKIKLSIDFGASAMGSKVGMTTREATYGAATFREREICGACVTRLREMLKLDKNDVALTKELFSNFDLPKRTSLTNS